MRRRPGTLFIRPNGIAHNQNSAASGERTRHRKRMENRKEEKSHLALKCVYCYYYNFIDVIIMVASG